MHPPDVHAEIRALVAAGLNDCEISRRIGVPLTTVRDIRAPQYVRNPSPRLPAVLAAGEGDSIHHR